MNDILPVDTIVSPNSSELSTIADYNILNGLLKNPLYKIPEELRVKAIGCLEATIDDASAKTTLKLKAIGAMINMDKHNLDLVKIAMPKKIEHINPRELNDEQLLEELNKIQEQLTLKLPKMVE